MYHDLGNLNCTFFTRRSKYDRRRNLDIICNAIGNVTNLDVSVNDREDIVLGHLGRDLKISGTAAKLGKDSAYHHCTVLVDVNECVLHDALHSKAVRIQNCNKIRQNVLVKCCFPAFNFNFTRKIVKIQSSIKIRENA